MFRERRFSLFALSISILFVVTMAPAQSGIDVLQSQISVSTQYMLANISAPGTSPGSVIAANSRVNPNYFFNWVRDAAVTMDLVNRFYFVGHSPRFQKMLFDYVNFTLSNQSAKTLGGIGEPKFNVNGTPFNGPWGRPQNDGPALRATTLTHFARILMTEGQTSYVRQKLYDGKNPSQSAIKVDLDYVCQHWGDTNFDLWEEVRGHHFYTLMVQRRALIEGSELARILGDGDSALHYSQVALEIASIIRSFWDGDRNILVPTIGRDGGISYKESGLDLGVILGVLHGSTEDGFLGPSNDMVLSTAFAIQNAFKKIYFINQDNRFGTAIGRYPEDLYSGVNSTTGGNPWFLGTLAFAELCYRAAADFQKAGIIKISPLNKFFLNEAVGVNTTLLPGTTITPDDPRFEMVLRGLAHLGDSFMNRALHHRGPDGSMSEQINRDSGQLQGAPNLTWSHASFLTASQWRLSLVPKGF